MLADFSNSFAVAFRDKLQKKVEFHLLSSNCHEISSITYQPS